MSLSGRPDTNFLTARPFAHRGLHGGGASENGIAAFRAAIAAGHGIECDVRMSRDGVAFVFHDGDLHRMTGQQGAIADQDAAQLDRARLPDGGDVPRLSDVLALCRGMTPLLVEIKTDGRPVAGVAGAVARELDAWPDASLAIMAFNPLLLRWFAHHRPRQVRGLVVSQQNKGPMRGWVERTLALWLGRPDFLACDIRDLPSPFAERARRRGMPVLSWTVRSPADQARAARHADQIIHELDHG